jgi:serine/threonine protein kinase
MITIDESKLQKEVEKYLMEFFDEPVDLEQSSYPTWTSDMVSRILENVLPSFIKDIKEVRIQEGEQADLCVLKNMEIEKTIYESYGSYLYKLKDQNKFVKIQMFNWSYKDYTSMRSLKKIVVKDYQIAKEAGKLGVGPKVTSMHTCLLVKPNKRYIVHVMDYIPGVTLEEFYKSNPTVSDTIKNKIRRILKAKVKVMHEHNISVGLLDNKSIYVELTEKGKLKDVYILNYTYSKLLSEAYKDRVDSDMNDIFYNVYGFAKLNKEKLSPIDYITGRLIDTKTIHIKN